MAGTASVDPGEGALAVTSCGAATPYHPTTQAFRMSTFARVALALRALRGLVVFRAQNLLSHPASSWAEDGGVFYGAAFNNNNALSLFGTPYMGYLHAFPRLCAAIAVLLPLHAGPFVFVSRVWSRFARHLLYDVRALLREQRPRLRGDVRALRRRPLSARHLRNPTNSQWHLSPVMLLISRSRGPPGPGLWPSWNT